MAIHANSIPASVRPLLPEELARFGLLPLAEPPQPGLPLDRALLAILDAGPITPDDLVVLSRHRRRSALLSIDSLIAALDALDPDPDLEDGGDTEPNAGGHGIFAHNDECELVCEDEGACIQSQPHDAEPDEASLGSFDRMLDQQHWAHGKGWFTGDDREVDRSDYEPSLGAPENTSLFAFRPFDQIKWAGGDRCDRELVNEDNSDTGICDNGIADDGGVYDAYLRSPQ